MAVLVTDNGQGIPPEEKEKIFEPFYQIDKHRTGNIRGVGLGLTLVKNLMTAYGGSVQVESEISQGATFTLSFPLC
jgi:two-component system phosphate regulon sensor histidine kinase PhoR